MREARMLREQLLARAARTNRLRDRSFDLRELLRRVDRRRGDLRRNDDDAIGVAEEKIAGPHRHAAARKPGKVNGLVHRDDSSGSVGPAGEHRLVGAD